MRRIHIDIESFSSVDLTRGGVYKYAEAEDFEVLLFGVSVDGGEVRVYDLASGDKLPASIKEALTDPKVIKVAHNANFERVCLSRYLGMPTGRYLSPASWRCTMTWAAYMGLPLSLAGVGAVLGLDKQKMSEGKDLMDQSAKGAPYGELRPSLESKSHRTAVWPNSSYRSDRGLPPLEPGFQRDPRGRGISASL